MYKRSLVFIASCLGMLLFGVSLITLGAILPSVVARFALNELQAGSLATLLPAGILTGSIVFGPIVDKYGYKSILIICSLLVALAMEGIAFSSTFIMLQAAVFVIGFGGGVINGSTNALVADISSEDKGASLSMLGVFFAIGALGMPAVLGALTGVFSTSGILAATGVVLLMPVVYFIAVKFPAPKQSQGFPLKQGIALVKDTTLLLMGFFLFFESAVEGITNNWATSYLEKNLAIGSKEALFALSLFVAGMAVTRFLLGYGLKRLSWFAALALSMVLIVIGCVLLLLASGFTAAVAALVLLGAGFAAGFPVMLGKVGERYAELSGTAFSLVITIALLGNMLLNYLTALTAHSFGIQYFIIIIIISAALMLVIINLISKRLSGKV